MNHALSPLFLLIALASPAAAQEKPPPEAIRVMTFNLWHGGDAGKQPLAQTIEVIKHARADIVGLQETAGFAASGPRPDRAAEIAKQLGWNYLDQGGRTGIISRFKIVSATPRKWGVRLETPGGRMLYHFNAHLAHAPYQPYQLLKIPYADAPFFRTAEEAVQAAKEARGAQVERLLAEVQAILPERTPIFLTGDFNEPSHQDWTSAAADKKLCPLAVDWPSTRAVATAGFRDAYRISHPDPTTDRGLTWTPTTKIDDPKDRHDRIDFVFVYGERGEVKSAQVVGESRAAADVVLAPYPSDHRAVVAEVILAP
jgi:endonuclease/exonuclease/phosphatase family metal-dependent hydrolase